MADFKKCGKCKGEGHINVLISQHDDKTEFIECTECRGKGGYYVMSDQDENDYWADFW